MRLGFIVEGHGEVEAAPEQIRGAKSWLDARMNDGYMETLDQAAFAALMDIESARGSYSFDNLVREVARLSGTPMPAAARVSEYESP